MTTVCRAGEDPPAYCICMTAKRRRAKARERRVAKSASISPSPQQGPHRVRDVVSGFALGIVITIVSKALLDFVPIYRTRLTIGSGTHAVRLERPVARTFNGVTYAAWATQVRVINRGLRPGHISHIDVVPVGINPIPRVTITAFDRGTFWPWRPRTITITGITYLTPLSISLPNCFNLDVYDDTGKLAFYLTWHGSRKPFPANTGGIASIPSCP